MQYILRDAEEVALLKKMDREMGEKCDPVVHYEFYFTEARFSEMFQALMQDIQSTGIDPKILETLMQEVNFTKLPQLPDDEFCEARPNQLHFLYAFFHFFSLPCGDDFVREWSNEDNRPILVQEFMTSYRNDPNINPGLIHCSPASM